MARPAPVALRDGLHFLALLRGTAHWLFFRDDVVSATVSAAELSGVSAPEPSAFSMLIVASLSLLARRRRRQLRSIT